MLFAELVALFLRFTRQYRRPRTVEFYESQLSKVAKAFPTANAADLRPVHLHQLKLTWHLVLSVQRLYRWAVDEAELLAVNPMLKLKRPRLGTRKRVMTPSEMARCMRVCRPDFRRFVLAARDTAARPQEVRELRWEDIRWEPTARGLGDALVTGRAFFTLLDYKGRDRRNDPNTPRTIPISPRLGRLLWRLCQGKQRSGLIFKTGNGLPWNRNSLRLRLRRMVTRARLPEHVQGERLVCYSIRHSTATDMADKGVQTSVIQLLLGHANIKTTQRYLHLQRHNLMRAWLRMHGRNDDGQGAGVLA